MKKDHLLFFIVFVIGCTTPSAHHPFEHYQSIAYNLVNKGWDALSRRNFTAVHEITDQCAQLYSEQAKSLNDKCKSNDFDKCSLLNDVAQCLYIKGEAYLQTNNYSESQKICGEINKWYFNSQIYDPNGWSPWKPSEACKSKI